ncbi:phospholipase A [Sphingomonas turrisvirgatae]|uniref:Phospholipase A1 n=1 Tax=Sphingomonas turrisvirgatae TaxID=1888892 RepID=A0A1E3LQR7_9SPHN|nr:phospholipase A [Sphingomonas turrisvirgatae]ODP36101.1 phospholipase [Sphingomonas turrisvirgatae]
MRAALFLLLIATPAAAQVRAIPAQPASEREALRGVEVILINEGASAVPAEGPRQIEVTAADGTRLVLERLPAPAATVAPGSFVKARYVPIAYAARPAPPTNIPGQPAPAPSTVGSAYAGDLPPPPATGTESETLASLGSAAGFLDRFSPHEPIYGVFGLDDAGAKLQVSFAFQPFGGDGAASRLKFAYTQTMFWRLDLPSGPFTHTTYSPEIFADVPLDPTATLGIGWRHDSNGEGTATSIDANRLFVRLTKAFDLGNGWRAEVAPQGWVYVGTQGVAPDLDRYWGHAALGLTLVKPDSLKLSVTARGDVRSGRGAAELFASYPLARIDGGIGFYLFGQAFTGFGEALDDYRRRDSHARIGIALTR